MWKVGDRFRLSSGVVNEYNGHKFNTNEIYTVTCVNSISNAVGFKHHYNSHPDVANGLYPNWHFIMGRDAFLIKYKNIPKEE